MGKKGGKKGKKKQGKQPKSNNKSKVSRSCWLVTSPLYKEFVELCEKNNWQEKKTLPRRGCREAKELDALMDKGLGRGQPLSRSQVNRKFKHWKRSNESEKKVRQLDVSKIESTKNLFERLKQTTTWTVMASKVEVDENVEDSPMLKDVIEGWLILELEDLRSELISAVNKLLDGENTSGDNGDSQYIEMEKKILEQFTKDFMNSFRAQKSVEPLLEQDGMDGRSRDIETRATALANVIGRQFVTLVTMAIKRGGDGNETMEKAVGDAIREFLGEGIDLGEDTLLRRTIFNISCWLIYAGKKQCSIRVDKDNAPFKSALQKVVDFSDATYDKESLRESLPTGKVDKMCYAKNHEPHYSSADFYELVLMLEKVCERLFVVRSLKIYGSGVADELADVLNDNSDVQRAVQKCSGDTLTADELDFACKYLTSTYMNMRSRDYVRQVMGASRRSLHPGTRAKLAVLSTEHSFKSKNKGSKKTFVCFFCAEIGHTVSRCEKIKVPPGENEGATRETVVKFADSDENTFVWEYCCECKGWGKHTTENHEYCAGFETVLGEEEERAAEVNSDDSDDEDVSDDEDDDEEAIRESVMEMENVISSLQYKVK